MSRGESALTSTTYLVREYVWGPGDWGVDELLAQFDQDRKASYPVQDAGGDVISLIDLGGGGGGGGTARTVATIVYDAYGRVIAHEHLYPHAYLRTGHKGLFFDRLDAGVADASTYEELPRLVAGSTLLGQNRNRTLNTQWGRFLQSDPNATGVAVMGGLSFHGWAPFVALSEVDLQRNRRDGASGYEYIMANPVRADDPLGLFPFSPREWWGNPSKWTDPHKTSRNPLRRQAVDDLRNSMRPRRNPGDFVGMMAAAGRGLGAFYAAYTLGTRESLWDDEAFKEIEKDVFADLATDALGKVSPGLGVASKLAWAARDGNLSTSEIMVLVAQASAEAAIERVTEFAGNSGDEDRFIRFGGRGRVYGEKVATHTVGTFFAGYAFIAGFYSGMVEYAADSVNQW